MALTIELPRSEAQGAFNERRWGQLLADPELARVEGRIETDRYGQIIMSPPPAPHHGRLQSKIAGLLGNLLPEGEVLTECPISTADGVKAADVAWASADCMRKLGNRACFVSAPEICIEVLSPCNTDVQIQEKMALYFDAGAQEVWVCAKSGAMKFYVTGQTKPTAYSKRCPQFPKRVALARFQ